jgi:YVTN family beta-propeller protein
MKWIVTLAAIAALAGAACRRQPSEPAQTGSSPAVGGRVRVYVTNETSGDLTIIDPGSQTVVGSAALGKRPRGIRVSPDRKSLYVALSGSPMSGPGVDRNSLPPADRAADGIGEVDVATGRVKRIIHAGVDPEQLDVSADGSRMYVANEDAAQMSVVDVATGTIVATVKIGEEPEGVSIRPDGKVVYVTCEGDGAVFAVDTATNAVLSRVEVGRRPRAIGFLPDGSRAFVTLENDGVVAVVDAQRHTFLQTIALDGPGQGPRPRPMGVAVRSDGSMIYVTTGSFGSLFFLDPSKNAAVASLIVGQRPWGIALLPDERTAYTANGPSNDVSVVDLSTRQVVKKIKVGERPWGVAIVDSLAPR